MDFNLKTILKSKITWTIATGIVCCFFHDKYKSRKRRIFISYHSQKNAQYKYTLNMWAKNQSVKFDFYDFSVGVSIKSKNESYIKKVITKKLNESNLVLCIIGEETHEREFIDWELEKAKELQKKIIAVKVNHRFKAPECLLNSNIKFEKYTRKDIFKAIKNS